MAKLNAEIQKAFDRTQVAYRTLSKAAAVFVKASKLGEANAKKNNGVITGPDAEAIAEAHNQVVETAGEAQASSLAFGEAIE
jgi:hypothetical protein